MDVSRKSEIGEATCNLSSTMQTGGTLYYQDRCAAVEYVWNMQLFYCARLWAYTSYKLP